MERIEIKNFAGIKEVSLEVKQINILIGPQASGKSIIAKLLFYFKNFVFEIISAAQQLDNKRDLDKNYKQKFKEYFPPLFWGNKDFEIKYYTEKEFIVISRKKSTTKKKVSEIILKYSDFYKEALTAFRDFIKKENEEIVEQENPFTLMSRSRYYVNLQRIFLSSLVEELNKKNIAFSQLYIPAGRSFFANLKNSIFTFLSESNTVDPFLTDFGVYYEKIKSPLMLEMFNSKISDKGQLYREIKLLNEKILCGKYVQKQGEDYLNVAEDRTITVANSSSGQQETLPLVLILRTMALMELNNRGDSIYIEEPEAHIFPTAQKNIVELISTVYNARKDSLQFLITTHSPYILTALNNLLQAGILATDATEEKIKQISLHVLKSRFLTPQEVAVYSLENGYCKSIIDEETGLIDTNIIDEVSNELAIQFDELLELEE